MLAQIPYIHFRTGTTCGNDKVILGTDSCTIDFSIVGYLHPYFDFANVGCGGAYGGVASEFGFFVIVVGHGDGWAGITGVIIKMFGFLTLACGGNQDESRVAAGAAELELVVMSL